MEGDGLGAAGGRGVAPQLVDDPLPGQGAVRVDEEECQELALPRRRDDDMPAVVDNLERAQNPELHRAAPFGAARC